MVAMMPVRPVARRANLSAPSMVSAPLIGQKDVAQMGGQNFDQFGGKGGHARRCRENSGRQSISGPARLWPGSMPGGNDQAWPRPGPTSNLNSGDRTCRRANSPRRGQSPCRRAGPSSHRGSPLQLRLPAQELLVHHVYDSICDGPAALRCAGQTICVPCPASAAEIGAFDAPVGKDHLLHAFASMASTAPITFFFMRPSAYCMKSLALARGNLADQRRLVGEVAQQAWHVAEDDQRFGVEGRRHHGRGAVAVHVDRLALVRRAGRREARESSRRRAACAADAC